MTKQQEQNFNAVAKGLAHNLRRELLVRIPKTKGASPSELAKILDESLPNVSHHVRQLSIYGLIELCNTEPRRGALEHYYTISPLGLKAVKIMHYIDKALK